MIDMLQLRDNLYLLMSFENDGDMFDNDSINIALYDVEKNECVDWGNLMWIDLGGLLLAYSVNDELSFELDQSGRLRITNIDDIGNKE